MATKDLQTLDIRVGTAEQLATLEANPDAIEFETDGQYPAAFVSFDNAGTTLTATDIQAAIVEVSQSSGDATGSTGYGVHGDYGMHYGIIDSPYGLITQGAGNQLKIAAGIQLCVPGADTYITLGSATTYDASATETFTLFYARGANGVGATFMEATDVVWSETEPTDNGATGYQAWWQPSHGLWQMRSNNTGNVWRDIVGGPLSDCKVVDGNIVRVDFIGYRVLNKQPTLPAMPTDDGSYVLKCVVSNGTTTLQWVVE